MHAYSHMHSHSHTHKVPHTHAVNPSHTHTVSHTHTHTHTTASEYPLTKRTDNARLKGCFDDYLSRDVTNEHKEQIIK